MAHTPGPWTINEWPQPAWSIGVGAVGTALICRVMLRDVSINEHKANATLIAAVPDLLVAAEYAEALIQARTVKGAREVIALQKLGAAIAKARGQ